MFVPMMIVAFLSIIATGGGLVEIVTAVMVIHPPASVIVNV